MFLAFTWKIVKTILSDKTDDRRDRNKRNYKRRNKTKQRKLVITEIQVKLKQVKVVVVH
jgi:hypothetical protein